MERGRLCFPSYAYITIITGGKLRIGLKGNETIGDDVCLPPLPRPTEGGGEREGGGWKGMREEEGDEEKRGDRREN